MGPATYAPSGGDVSRIDGAGACAARPHNSNTGAATANRSALMESMTGRGGFQRDEGAVRGDGGDVVDEPFPRKIAGRTLERRPVVEERRPRAVDDVLSRECQDRGRQRGRQLELREHLGDPQR